jgi:4-hydroxybenzoate polyprenyltransferase
MALIMETAVAVRQNKARAALLLLSCIRLGEVLVLQGSPLLGALFAMDRITTAGCMAIVSLATGSVLLVAHVFVLNDWSGVDYDLRDPNRSSGLFANRSIRRNGIAYLSLALLTLGLLLLRTFGYATLTIAVAIAGLSALYSLPRIHMKGVPVLSSALHFTAGLLHFLLGYSVFRTPDWRGIEIGSFFALVFVAGHLIHETSDSDSDLANGIRTNAVTFGKLRSFICGVLLFTIADVLLMVLALRGIVPGALAAVVVIAPLHVYWSVEAIRTGLTFEGIRLLRTRYRTLYAATGLLIAVAVLFAR